MKGFHILLSPAETGKDFMKVTYFDERPLHTKLDECKCDDFEDTCEAIDACISKGTIRVEELDPHTYPDDVDAIEKLICATAEELHKDD